MTIIKPSLLLDFANSRQVDPRVTFSRGSAATYFDRLGVMRSAPANAPRINHRAATGECLGLYVEGGRTNLATYSEQFDNAAWGKNYCTVSANAAPAPDGTTTADKIVEDATGGIQHYISRTFSVTSGTTYAISVMASADELRYLALGVAAGAEAKASTFDLVAGTVTFTEHTLPPKIEYAGNGAWRCTIVVTATGSSLTIQYRLLRAGNIGFEVYTGDGASGLHLWGGQIETGRHATSYIKTEGSTVTASGDVVTISGANFTQWYRPDEGTFVIDGDFNGSGLNETGGNSFRFLIDVDDGTGNSNVSHVIVASAGYGPGLQFSVADGAVTRSNNGSLTLPSARLRAALAYSKASSRFALNGADAGFSSELTQSPGARSRLTIGGSNGGAASNAWVGHIRHLAYYPARLTDAELRLLTT